VALGALNGGRFDYVRYDAEAQKTQAEFKAAFEKLEALTDSGLKNGRAKSLALTKLEEAYMWVGKAIRDEQVAKRTAELLEERADD
jgi:hypothetical protein